MNQRWEKTLCVHVFETYRPMSELTFDLQGTCFSLFLFFGTE